MGNVNNIIRTMLAIMALYVLAVLGAIAGLIWVIAHFLKKVW